MKIRIDIFNSQFLSLSNQLVREIDLSVCFYFRAFRVFRGHGFSDFINSL